MRAMVVTRPGGSLEPADLPLANPGPGEVRVRVQACGICHGDFLVLRGLWPGMELPRAPGHEVAGVVDMLGPGVQGLRCGERVGIGWHGGHCGVCPACREGDFLLCQEGKVCGLSYHGGYAEYVVAPAEALAPIPDSLPDHLAAPLLCAGVTTWNALQHCGARPGELVAVQGLGGLGHLGVLYAVSMGFRVAVISRGPGKRRDALELGAHHFLDASAADPLLELRKLGGAKAILATAPDAGSIGPLVAGLGRNGNLIVVGTSLESFSVSSFQLIATRSRISGWPSGTSRDSAEALRYSAAHGIHPRVELFPLERANEALARLEAGEVRYRAVLDLTGS